MNEVLTQAKSMIWCDDSEEEKRRLTVTWKRDDVGSAG
jgi:hypothetical protein